LPGGAKKGVDVAREGREGEREGGREGEVSDSNCECLGHEERHQRHRSQAQLPGGTKKGGNVTRRKGGREGGREGRRGGMKGEVSEEKTACDK